MKRYLLDTFCWLELFTNGPKKPAVKRILAETDATILISSLSLAEVSARLTSAGRTADVHHVLSAISARATKVEIDESIAAKAGEYWAKFHSKQNIGLIDCVIAASALANDAIVVTGDPHFKAFPNAIIL